jgi:hypothetical protein
MLNKGTCPRFSRGKLCLSDWVWCAEAGNGGGGGGGAEEVEVELGR